MAESAFSSLEAGTNLGQSVRFHSRERRRSLAGVPELFRTLSLAIPTASIPTGSFPDREAVFTFQTAIRITGGTPVGLIFEFGNATTAIAAWLNDTDIQFRAGGVAAADRGLATFDNTVSLPLTLEMDLVFAVRPGDGRVRIWANGGEIARDTASGGAFPAGWAADSAGAFAAAASGALPADVLQTGAPSDFDVIQPMSVFAGQVPRHFV